jgi:hypothetical protein
MMKPMRLHYVSIVEATVDLWNLRYKDEADHEDATGLLFVGDVASADAEKTCNNIWWNLGRR